MTNGGENLRNLVQKLVSMTRYPRYAGDTKPGQQYWLPNEQSKDPAAQPYLSADNSDGFLGEVNHYPQKSEVSVILRQIENGDLTGFSILFRIRTHGEIHRIVKMLSNRKSERAERVTFYGHHLLYGDEAQRSLKLLKRFISEGKRYTTPHRRPK